MRLLQAAVRCEQATAEILLNGMSLASVGCTSPATALRCNAALRQESKNYIVPLMAFKRYNVSETAIRKHARILVEARLGRRLRKDEIVHHADGDAYNIEPTNLVVTDRYTHQIWHKQGK